MARRLANIEALRSRLTSPWAVRAGWAFAALALFGGALGPIAVRNLPSGRPTHDACARAVDRYLDYALLPVPEGTDAPWPVIAAHLEDAKRTFRDRPEYLDAISKCERKADARQVACAVDAGSSGDWESCF